MELNYRKCSHDQFMFSRDTLVEGKLNLEGNTQRMLVLQFRCLKGAQNQENRIENETRLSKASLTLI